MQRLLSALSLIPETCLLASGWQRRAIALAAGAFCALALPPFYLWPILFLSLPVLIWLLDGLYEVRGNSGKLSFKAAFGTGWWFGLGYFMASLWWISAAFLVDGERFAWMIPFALVGMGAGLGLFTGLAVAIATRFWSDKSSRIMPFALALSAAEILRGHILTGFPWNAIGYAISDNIYLLQSASVFGIYGLNLLVLFICAAPAVLADERGTRSRRPVLFVASLCLGAMFCFGIWRIEVAEKPELTNTDIRIIQPAIPQDQKWLPQNRDWVFNSYLSLTSSALGSQARLDAERLVIWPESSLPFLLQQTPEAFVAISSALNGTGNLAVGAIRQEISEGAPRYFNSIYLMNGQGVIQDAYDKVHLVPFGEYLPFEDLLSGIGLRKLVDAPGAFTAGHSRRLMTLPSGLSLLPLICYEAIFPGMAASEDGRPDFLLNVTNDAWFGDTPGPYQHLAQARMRAVEQGLPLVRAANTGVSALIDPHGVTLGQLPLMNRGVLDLPLTSSEDLTIFVQFGWGATICLNFFCLFFWVTQIYNPQLARRLNFNLLIEKNLC